MNRMTFADMDTTKIGNQVVCKNIQFLFLLTFCNVDPLNRFRSGYRRIFLSFTYRENELLKGFSRVSLPCMRLGQITDFIVWEKNFEKLLALNVWHCSSPEQEPSFEGE